MKRAASLSVAVIFALAAGLAHAQSGGTNQQGASGGGPAAGGSGASPEANKGNRPSELPNLLKNGMGNGQGTGLPGEADTDTGRKLVTQ